VTAVRDHLTQVILNLVLNAIDATDAQGRIHLQAGAEDGGMMLSVEDDGRGISVADRCRLFQPFFTTKPHGTGLGLFVSRQILEEFAGTLTYRSEPGHGSTFIIRLPCEATMTAARPDASDGHSARQDSPGEGIEAANPSRPEPVAALPTA